MVYWLLRAFTRHALAVYFREVEIEGRDQVPATGPLLVTANHPNTLIDVLLIGTALERQVGFVAKAPLFKGPTGLFLRWMGAVPVARRMDGPLDGGARDSNRNTLRFCEESVGNGNAILIFPEGTSTLEPRLLELRTGAARIALGAQARTQDPVRIVPVALGYDEPESFRSRARVSFGPPIEVRPFFELQEQLERDGGDVYQPARALTEALREAMLQEVVHVADDGREDTFRELDLLYGRKVEGEVGSRLLATATIARALNRFAEQEPERVAEVEQALGAYREALEGAGVDDAAVAAQRGQIRSDPAADLSFYVGAPLAAWGIVNHALFYPLPGLVVTLGRPHPTYTSTVQLVSGIIFLALCYFLQTWLVVHLAGWQWGIGYLGTLPLTGVIALLWLEGWGARRQRGRARQALAELPSERVAGLRQQREGVMAKLDQARVAFLAAHLPAEVAERAELPDEADTI